MSEPTPSEPVTEFALQKVYVKDLSFESPESPQVFNHNLEPKTQLDVKTGSSVVDDTHHEVVLTITVTVSHQERTLFVAEVQQAGLIMVKGLPDHNKGHFFGAYCPSMLFPFAREAISDLTVRGGFPPLLLAPVHFDGLYQQQIAQSAASQPEPANG